MQTKNAVGSPDWTDPDDAPALTEGQTHDVEAFEKDTFVRRGRGRPPTGKAKELISVRLDPEVLTLLRQAGPGWQSRVNTLLRVGLNLDDGMAAQQADAPAAGTSSHPAGLMENAPAAKSTARSDARQVRKQANAAK